MDRLTSFTEIIKAAMWPAVVGFAIYILKSDIKELLQSLRSVEFGKGRARAKFGKELRKAIDDVETEKFKASTPPSDRAKFPQLVLQEKISETMYPFDVTQDHPAGAAIEAWQELQKAAERAVKRLKIRMPEYGGYGAALGEAGVFIPTQQRLFQVLNGFQYMPDITPLEAARFVALMKLFTEYFDSLTALPPKWDEQTGQEKK